MTEFYPIISIETDTEIPEFLGTKEKFWINHNNNLCLLKFGREGTGEDWAEKIACELCSLLDLPHAHYDFALFRGQSGVISPSIVEKDGRLILGNELTNASRKEQEEARFYRQKEHTVSRVLAALATSTKPNYGATWHQFIGYLMLDAWIGNTDRHHENWALVVSKERAISLAPTFDHASSLGRELTDEVRMKRLRTKDSRYTVAAFAQKARSALYHDPQDKTPLTPRDAFLLGSRAKRDSGFFWLDKLEMITDDEIARIIARVPHKIMSEAARQFATRILEINKSELLSFKKKPA